MTKFKIGQIVQVFDVNQTELLDCKILEIDTNIDEPVDYLCLPLDNNKMILGQWELGSGWVWEHNIKAKNELHDNEE